MDRTQEVNVSQAEPASVTRRGEFIDGMKAIFPLVLSAIPFGVAFGAVAVTNGLSPGATVGMSLFVFAGAAQFIAAGLVGEGVGVGLIVLTTFIVNLRHMLYGASLSPYMRQLSQRWLIPLGHLMTDEAYAVTIKRYMRDDGSPYKHWFFLGGGLLMFANWQLCTWIGFIAGGAVPDATSWGLDFAMVVTFIGIVVPLVTTRPMLAAVGVAGMTALLFNGLPHNLGLILASLSGITAGYLLETHQIRRGHTPNEKGASA